MFLLADMMTWCEVANAMCKKAAGWQGSSERSSEYMNAAARLFARDAVEKVFVNGLKVCRGCETALDDLQERLDAINMTALMKGNLKDMDTVAMELKK